MFSSHNIIEFNHQENNFKISQAKKELETFRVFCFFIHLLHLGSNILESFLIDLSLHLIAFNFFFRKYSTLSFCNIFKLFIKHSFTKPLSLRFIFPPYLCEQTISEITQSVVELRFSEGFHKQKNKRRFSHLKNQEEDTSNTNNDIMCLNPDIFFESSKIILWLYVELFKPNVKIHLNLKPTEITKWTPVIGFGSDSFSNYRIVITA